MKQGISILILLFTWSVHTHAQIYKLAGPTSVNHGTSHNYFMSPDGTNPPEDYIHSTVWHVEGGTLQSSSNTSAIVKWDGHQSNGRVWADYFVGDEEFPKLTAAYVTINGAPPAAPSNPVISSSGCTEATLSRNGTPSSEDTWYWQGKNANGKSISLGSGATFVADQGSGTYYIRARKNNGIWSDESGAVMVTIPNDVLDISVAPTVTNNCESTVLKRGNPPSGVTWYWQSSSGGTSTSNSSSSITRTSGTVYYLRARHDESGCWGNSRKINYTVTQKQTWYADFDGDNFGDPNDTKEDCTKPANYIEHAGDQCPGVFGTDNGCPNEEYTAISLSDNENYIYKRTYQKKMTGPGGVEYNRDVIESVTYYDGLGRPKQEVAIRQSPSMLDVVTHIEYDPYGRQEKEYLPYMPVGTVGSDGSFRTGDVARDTREYYQIYYPEDFEGMANADVNAYSRKQFEPSPLNRVEKQAAPGKDWKLDNGHEIEFDYGTNTATEVRRYEVGLTESVVNTVMTYVPSLELNTSVDNGYYKAGTLYKTVTYDENHETGKDHSTEEFKNKQGQVVLKRSYNNSQKHDTYYVYDDYGNLTYVLPPKAEAHAAKPDATEFAELCYQYRYDARNRLVAKKIPGKGWEYIVYNTLDQPVMTQDGNMRAANNPDLTTNQWLFTKYDAFGSVVYTGQTNDDRSREELQQIFNTTAKKYESRLRLSTDSPTNINGTDVYYTNDSPPTNIAQVHTVNYYDDYDFDTSGLSLPQKVFDQDVDTRTKTLATGNKIRVLGTEQWITTISGYNTKDRVIYTASKNPYLNTTDIVENKLDFAGKVLETRTTHTKGSNAPIVTTDKFEYDHTGRLVRQLQCINGDCGGDTTGDNPVFDDALTEAQHEVASNSITLKPGFHFKATSSISFSASISPAGELIAENVYDDLGQLEQKKVGNTQSKPLQTIDYTYNVRGWLKAINNPDAALGEQLFAFGIRYNDPAYNPADRALYNGNISETYWRTANDDRRRNYRYTYDALNRITGAMNTGAGEYTRYELKNVAYDKNGNITDLTRNGWQNSSDYDNMDVLDYRYNATNRLLKVIDTGNKAYGFKDGTNTNNDYTYDVNGNLTSDANKGITGVSYNYLNLPTEIKFNNSDTKKITYFYGADGIKLRKVVNNAGNVTTTDYDGSYVYENGSLKQVSHPEGYFEPKAGGGYQYVYRLTDIWGNTRVTYADDNGDGVVGASEIRREQNYYPGGLEHRGYNGAMSGIKNNLKTYQGQEFTEDLGLNTHEWRFRVSDPATLRFWQIDPLAEDYTYNSAYAFAENKLGMGIELEGLEVQEFNNKDKKVQFFTPTYKPVGTIFSASGSIRGKIGPSVNIKASAGNTKASVGASVLEAKGTVTTDPALKGQVDIVKGTLGFGVQGLGKSEASVAVGQLKGSITEEGTDGEVSVGTYSMKATGGTGVTIAESGALLSSNEDINGKSSSSAKVQVGAFSGKLKGNKVGVGASVGPVSGSVSADVDQSKNAVSNFFNKMFDLLINGLEKTD